VKDQPSYSSAFRLFDGLFLSSGAIASVAFAILKTSWQFWLPFWFILSLSLLASALKKDEAHWPSSIFGCVSVIYIGSFLTLLYRSQVSIDSLLYLLCGAVFIHGFLYLIAARSFLRSRGILKAPNQSPEPMRADGPHGSS